MARKFFEVVDLRYLIHLVDDLVEDRFNFFVCLLDKESALVLETRSMPNKLLAVELRDLFLPFGGHIRGDYTFNILSPQVSF